MNWYKEHTLIVRNLEVANYMIDHECEMIGIEAIPKKIIHTKMIFRSENVNEAYRDALRLELPSLTYEEEDRLISMIALLSCAKRQELAEAEGKV